MATNSAIDLNADGTILTSNSALKGPEAELWEAAHAEEIEILLSSETGHIAEYLQGKSQEWRDGEKSKMYNRRRQAVIPRSYSSIYGKAITISKLNCTDL